MHWLPRSVGRKKAGKFKHAGIFSLEPCKISKVEQDNDDLDSELGAGMELEKKLKCGKWPYEALEIGHFNRHFSRIHDKIKNHICEDCEYATSDLSILRRHRTSVHKIDLGVKTLKCGKCPYETLDRGHLARHFRRIHDKIKSKV